MSTNAPKNVIRECELLLSGDLQQSPEQFQRWVIVQIKKLAHQASARHLESAQIRNQVKKVEHFVKGGEVATLYGNLSIQHHKLQAAARDYLIRDHHACIHEINHEEALRGLLEK